MTRHEQKETAPGRADPAALGQPFPLARLCSAAANEIVADAEIADDAFGPVETIRVKGRRQPLAVRRFRAAGAGG